MHAGARTERERDRVCLSVCLWGGEGAYQPVLGSTSIGIHTNVCSTTRFSSTRMVCYKGFSITACLNRLNCT